MSEMFFIFNFNQVLRTGQGSRMKETERRAGVSVFLFMFVYVNVYVHFQTD